MTSIILNATPPSRPDGGVCFAQTPLRRQFQLADTNAAIFLSSMASLLSAWQPRLQKI